MTDVLKIDEWTKLVKNKNQFFFIDPEFDNIAERIKDGAVFFAGDFVYFKNDLCEISKGEIYKFDKITMSIVYLTNGCVTTINEIYFEGADCEMQGESVFDAF